MNWEIYIYCVVGIITSLLLPIVAAAVRTYFPAPKAGPAGIADAARSMWSIIKPYSILGLFSCLTAILIVFAMGDRLSSIQAALLAGYAWDSTLQKIRQP